MKKIKLQIIAAALSFAPIVSSHADLVAFNFTGTVYDVDAPLRGSFSVGDTISGSYIFDTSVPDQIPGDPTQGVYVSNTPYSVGAGDFSLSGTGVASIVYHDYSVGNGYFEDGYTVSLNPVSSAPSVNGYESSGFVLGLSTVSATSPTSSPTSSDALPTMPPAIDAFSDDVLIFVFTGPTGGEDYVEGNVSTLTLCTVPEPSSALLLLFGTIFLIRSRERY